MRLATWNVNSVGARLPRLVDWLETREPDVVALQETKCADAAFPHAEVEALGYEVAHNGDGRWNGTALLSRVGLEDVELSFAGQPPFAVGDALLPPAVEARAVGATCGGVRVWSLYVPERAVARRPALRLQAGVAGRPARRARAAGRRGPVRRHWRLQHRPDRRGRLGPVAVHGSTHVTPAERAALQALLDLGLVDVAARPGKGDAPYTYWDYRAGMFHKDNGMRIDLVLATPSLSVRDAYVDREARKGKGPSDHAPVVVDLDV